MGSRRVPTLVAAVAGLVIVVAVASGQSRHGTARTAPSNPRWVLDAGASLATMLVLFAVVVLALGLRPKPSTDDDDADPAGRRQSRQKALVVVIAWACLVLVLAALRAGATHRSAQPVNPELPQVTGTAAKPVDPGSGGRIFDPWVVVGVVASALAVGGAVAVTARSRRLRARSWLPASAAARSAKERMVEDSLAAIDDEPDPRRAVIAAYASMRRWLQRAGVPPERWEAPFEYLDRVLVSFGARATTAAALTRLFEEARFGHHPMTADQRQAAIDALTSLRTEILVPA